MKKRHFTKLSAFALAAALSVITAAVPFGDAFPITSSITASAAEYVVGLETLKICGVSVVNYGYTDVTSGSNWNYNPASNTLYIDGENSYNDTLGGNGAYIYVEGNLTIKVTGNSKITSKTDSVGIYSDYGEVNLIIDECFSLTFSLCNGSMSNGCRGAIAANKWFGPGGSVKMNEKEIECEKNNATIGGHTCENGKCTKCGAFEITEENFPDEKFRTYLKTFDTDKDGLLSAAELEKVTKIDVNSKEISDLKGIELFTALEELDCGSNRLTTLDLSKNLNLEKLDCDGNQLTSLNLANNTKLREVDCCGNSITELDVRKNINLTELNCSSNNLPSLDVSKNINLKNLNCSSDSLMSLDVSKNINLTELNCSSNNLPSLDTGDNSDITSIDCSLNYLTQLDVSSFKKLSKLDCHSNQLTELDVTGCGSLTDLDCSSNKLTELDVKNNTELTELDCSHNSISSLNLNNNANLTKLRCTGCELESLDLSGNQLLEDLYCEYNNMISLNFANNASLVNLWCGYNNLEELDLSNCEQLVSLRCYDNMLKKIDANSCTKLENFYCNDNQLNSLDLSNCNIKILWLKNNPIAAINCSNDLSSRSNRLDFCPVSENESTFDITKYGGDPTRIGTVTGGELVNNIIKPNESTDKVTYEYKYNSNSESVINCTVYFSEEGKELIYINKENFPDDHFRDYVINSLKDASNHYVGEDGVLTADEIAEVKKISVSYRSISDLKGIEYFTALTDLYCNSNDLTSLDVSKNTALTELNCSYNKLTSLDVSNSTALTSLYCYSNNLTSLDLSNNTALTSLYCYSNNLTSLDLSNNTKLTELECSSNFLTKLDLSKNTLLTKLYCRFNPLTSLDLSATAVTDLSANTELKEYAYKTVFDGGKLDLTTLNGFDVSKADSWDNATIEGNIISIIDPTEPVAYFYDTGREKDAWFMIAAESVSLTADMIEKIADQTYTGKEFEPKPVVKCGNYTLVEGTDYTLSYDKNTEAGTGKVIVTAKGDFYTGSAEAEFKINKAAPAEIILPTASGLTYGQELSESILSDENWKWVDGKVIPTVNNDGYKAAIDADDKNYDYSDVEGYNEKDHTVTRTIEVTVKKATPAEIILPTASGLTYGQKLSESVLSDENWSWVDGDIIPEVENDGFKASITVDDKNYDYSDVEGYNEKDHTITRTIEVTVKKATPAEIILPTASGLTYGQKLSESVLSDENWKWVDGKVIPTVNNDGYDAVIEVDDKNYDYLDVEGYNEEDHTVTRTIKVTVSTATPAEIIPPTASGLTYGQELSESVLSDENWQWVDGKVIPIVNNDGYDAVIEVDDKNYDYLDVEGYNEEDHTVTRTIKVTVSTATPAEIIPPTASGLTYGQELSESVLSDENWKWVDGKVIPTVNNDGYEASIIVDDKNYDYSADKGYNEKDHTVTRTIEVTVKKATPAEIILPTASGLTYGQKLSESILSDENWKWVDGTVIPTVKNDGYEAAIDVDDKNYDYSDVKGYNEEDHTVTRTIEVTVEKATPAEIIPPTASGLTYGQKLSESTLSDENWKWVDGDIIPEVENDGFKASITVDDKNYDYSDVEGYNEKDHTVTRTIEVTVKKAAPAEIILPTASGLTYGQKLSESVLSDENWKWVDGKVIPTVNNDGYEAAIDVDDKNYDYSDVEGYNEKDHTVTRTIEVTVEKAAPTVNPVIDDADYEDGDDLPEIRLSENDTLGKVEWIEKIAKLVEGKNILDWKFTPENENYNDVTGTLIVNAKATTTTTTTVTTTTTKPTTSTTKATTVTTTKATTASTTKPTTAVSTTKATTASATKPTTAVSTTKATTASTTKPTTASTTKPTTVSTTKATTASTTKPTTAVSTTKATTASTTKLTTAVSTTKATTASTTKPTTAVSTTKATTASATKPTTAVSTTKATTASATKPTTVSTTKATTTSATKPTTAVSTTKATTASATKPTTAVSTTKATTASTTKPTTVSTTKATTANTTKATTVSTTKATTANTTKPTTVSTTKATTANTTKPTTAVSTTKATVASTTGTTVSSSTSTSTPVSTTAISTTSTPTTTTVPPTTTPQVTEVLGDANDDGKLDVRDAAHIARMLAQRDTEKLPAKADFNGDGKTDVRDAAAIARFLAKNHKK